jgi:hypothetical protein
MARQARCGGCGTLRTVGSNGRFRAHRVRDGAACSGGRSPAVIAAEDAWPGDVVVFVTGRAADVAAVTTGPAGPGGTRYVTIRHDPPPPGPGAPVPVLTICQAGTPVGLAGTGRGAVR